MGDMPAVDAWDAARSLAQCRTSTLYIISGMLLVRDQHALLIHVAMAMMTFSHWLISVKSIARGHKTG